MGDCDRMTSRSEQVDQTKLNEELAAIHEELGQVLTQSEKLDGAMIQSLRLVAADIERVLKTQRAVPGAADGPGSEESDWKFAGESARSNTGTGTGANGGPGNEETPHTLEALAEQFSVDHPQTAALLSRLGYLLSNLGI